MSDFRTLRIETADLGVFFETRTWQPRDERIDVDRQTHGVPMSDHWYQTGSGAFNPRRFEYRVRAQGESLDAALVLAADFMFVAERATKLIWGNRESTVFGLTGPIVRVPILRGYTFTVAFAPDSGWQVVA